MTQHLISIGRRCIAHLSGDAGYSAARDRADGVWSALSPAGLSLAGEEVRYGNWSEARGRAAANTLLDQHPDLDAIVCGSDQIARGALEMLPCRLVIRGSTVAG